MISPFMAIYNNHVLTTCLSFPVCLTDAEKTQLNRLNMVACERQPLFARATKAFFMHLDFTTTKGPHRADVPIALCHDFVMLKVDHEIIHTTMKTVTPTTAPKRRPVIRPQISARPIKTPLNVARQYTATIHQKRTARS